VIRIKVAASGNETQATIPTAKIVAEIQNHRRSMCSLA
jgi:hypothetical protein